MATGGKIAHMAQPRPRRMARAEAYIERNQSDGRKFVRIKVYQNHPTHGLLTVLERAIDEGTAFQLSEKLQECLNQLEKERQ